MLSSNLQEKTKQRKKTNIPRGRFLKVAFFYHIHGPTLSHMLYLGAREDWKFCLLLRNVVPS